MGKNDNAEKGYDLLIGAVSGLLRILIIILLIVILIFGAKTAYAFGYRIFNEVPMEAPPGTDVTVTIPNGWSVRDIGAELKDKGIISDVLVFMVQERLSEAHGKLEPGTYILNTSQTSREIFAILSKENTEGQPGGEE